MKVLFSTNRNPKFMTITEYIENALQKKCTYFFFDDRPFMIPGKIRKIIPVLNRLELQRINSDLLSKIEKIKPDIFLGAGFFRIFPETVEKIKKDGIKTVLWTIDPLKSQDELKRLRDSAVHYDFVFVGGTEVSAELKNIQINNLYWLPFACDTQIHRRVGLTHREKAEYSCDIAFVGTVDPRLYAYRVKLLEGLSDLKISVWGPGVSALPKNSLLKPLVRGAETPAQTWRKIYSAAKIVLCIHFREPNQKIPCYQASPRVYEALACKSFLLVDNQRDVSSLFKDGEHLVIFKDLTDLREKIEYYLEHPQERERIAQAGYREVVNKHTYDHRIKEMFDIVTREG